MFLANQEAVLSADQKLTSLAYIEISSGNVKSDSKALSKNFSNAAAIGIPLVC